MPGEGGGGAGSMDWVGLGTQIHEDSLESMTFFSDLMNKEWEKRSKDRDFFEGKRQFKEKMNMSRRDQNMAGIKALQEQRMIAEQESRMKLFLTELGR